MNVAIYLYPDVEVLDFAGPFEVFTTATRVAKLLGVDGDTPLFDVRMVAHDLGPIRARGGLVIQPGFAISDDHPAIDILMIPGGIVTAELGKKAVVDWIKRTATLARITASVCTGAFLLAEAGLLQNKRATTHWDDVQDLRRSYPNVQVLEGCRWVDEGNVVTAAGISAGIDMSLHLVARLTSRELAVRTARQMEYTWVSEK